MKACKTPCKDCPFTTYSLPGWLADYTPEELHRIIMSEQPFPCHMTHEEEISWEDAGSDEFPLCAGALGYMRKAGKLPLDIDLKQLRNTASVENILSVPEFFKRHTIE